jgi:hypothetical protein
VIEAESQAVLNTLTEKDFHGAFKKKWQKLWERCIALKGDWWPVEPKLVCYQMSALVPVIMNGSL